MNIKDIAALMRVQLRINYNTGEYSRDHAPLWQCAFDDCEVKGDGVLTSAWGGGSTPQEAMNNYTDAIRGKTLVVAAASARREFFVPTTLELP